MPVSLDAMDKMLQDFFEEEQKNNHKNEKKENQQNEKKDNHKQKIQNQYIYKDPQKDKLSAVYSQNNYQPPVLLEKRNQFALTSRTIFYNMFQFFASIFNLVCSLPWYWILGILLFIYIIFNIQNILATIITIIIIVYVFCKFI